MVISSRTPEGTPNQCPVCGSRITIEPSNPPGDAPCPACGYLLWFTWEDVGDAVVIKPTSAILRSEELAALVDRPIEKRGITLVFDLRNVHYLASDALGKLINLKKKLMQVKGKLKIEHIHPDLREVFRITRLNQVFDLGS